MKSVLVLLMLISGTHVLACKMTPLGASARSINAITEFVLSNEQHDSSLRAVYRGTEHYVYETVTQDKCRANAVKVNVGPDCSHAVVRLNNKINCRLK